MPFPGSSSNAAGSEQKQSGIAKEFYRELFVTRYEELIVPKGTNPESSSESVDVVSVGSAASPFAPDVPTTSTTTATGSASANVAAAAPSKLGAEFLTETIERRVAEVSQTLAERGVHVQLSEQALMALTPAQAVKTINTTEKIKTVLSDCQLAWNTAAGRSNAGELQYNALQAHSLRLRQEMFNMYMDADFGHWLHAMLLFNLPAHLLCMYVQLLRTLRFKQCNAALLDKVLQCECDQAGQQRRQCHLPADLHAALANFLHKKPPDPTAGLASRNPPALTPNSTFFLLVPPFPQASNSGVKFKRHDYFYKFLFKKLVVNDQWSEVKFPAYFHDATVTDITEKMLMAVRDKLAQVIKYNRNRNVFLVGWDTSCLVNVVVALEQPVAGLIHMAFPNLCLSGERGLVDDDLISLKHCPSLFVVGQFSTRTSINLLQDTRDMIMCETGVIVVGGADHQLSVSTDKLNQLGLTQKAVDLKICSEMSTFVHWCHDWPRVQREPIEFAAGDGEAKSMPPRASVVQPPPAAPLLPKSEQPPPTSITTVAPKEWSQPTGNNAHNPQPVPPAAKKPRRRSTSKPTVASPNVVPTPSNIRLPPPPPPVQQTAVPNVVAKPAPAKPVADRPIQLPLNQPAQQVQPPRQTMGEYQAHVKSMIMAQRADPQQKLLTMAAMTKVTGQRPPGMTPDRNRKRRQQEHAFTPAEQARVRARLVGGCHCFCSALPERLLQRGKYSGRQSLFIAQFFRLNGAFANRTHRWLQPWVIHYIYLCSLLMMCVADGSDMTCARIRPYNREEWQNRKRGESVRRMSLSGGSNDPPELPVAKLQPAKRHVIYSNTSAAGKPNAVATSTSSSGQSTPNEPKLIKKTPNVLSQPAATVQHPSTIMTPKSMYQAALGQRANPQARAQSTASVRSLAVAVTAGNDRSVSSPNMVEKEADRTRLGAVVGGRQPQVTLRYSAPPYAQQVRKPVPSPYSQRGVWTYGQPRGATVSHAHRVASPVSAAAVRPSTPPASVSAPATTTVAATTNNNSFANAMHAVRSKMTAKVPVRIWGDPGAPAAPHTSASSSSGSGTFKSASSTQLSVGQTPQQHKPADSTPAAVPPPTQAAREEGEVSSSQSDVTAAAGRSANQKLHDRH